MWIRHNFCFKEVAFRWEIHSYRKTHTVWNVQQTHVQRVIWKYFHKGDADLDGIEGPFSSPSEVGHTNKWCWKNVCWAIIHCFFQWFLISGGSWVPFLDPHLAMTFLWLISKSLFLFLLCEICLRVPLELPHLRPHGHYIHHRQCGSAIK